MSSIKKIKTTEGDLSFDYNSLDNLPTIPSKTSDITNDNGFITKSVGNLDNYYTKDDIDTNYCTKLEANTKENSSNKVTSINSSSTNTQYPSAKCVYDWMSGIKIVALTQTQYDALTTKDADTLYFITGA